MSLLHWSILTPSPSGIAAVRFPSASRIQSITIFPTGAHPFAQHPEIIAETAPSAFYLDVFVNAHPVRPLPQSQHPKNALVPTVIAYAGGQVRFTFDMGPHYATRLLIFKGPFQSLSAAIYGTVVTMSESLLTEQPEEYVSTPLPSFEPIALNKAVDPSNSSQPTLLAQQLLSLLPDAPPLPIVNRLMLCLKPLASHWSHPDFPYLVPDLENEDEDLRSFAELTVVPVSDNLDDESMHRFAKRVSSSIQGKSKANAQDVSQILRNVAPQHPHLARILLEHIVIQNVFDVDTVDEQTARNLLDAVANCVISRHFEADWFSSLLQDIQNAPSSNTETRLVCRRIEHRIRGWRVLNDAISNTRGDFCTAVVTLQDFGREEYSFGVFLASVITHEDLIAKLGENPVLPPSRAGLPLALFHQDLSSRSISHDEFIRFLRAYIGVGAVLNAFSWTDSIPADLSRERTMNIMQLWQGVDGYRQILNHLLMIPQYIGRLDIIIDSDLPPRPCDIMAERLLAELVRDPQAILKQKVIDTILDMKPPFRHITEDDRRSMRKVALVSEDGLPAAIEELTFSSDHPLSLRRLRTLRVSLAVLARELDDGKEGEWKVLNTLWEEGVHGLIGRLVDIFVGVSSDLAAHFKITALPPQQQQLVVDQLLQTGDDLLKLIIKLAPAYPLTVRALRELTGALADVFTCTDIVEMVFSASTPASVSAASIRQTCISTICALTQQNIYAEPHTPGALIVLRELLNRAVRCGDRDAAYHLIQVFCLIDHVLPKDDPFWATEIIPKLLLEIKSFFGVLDTDNKGHFIKRLSDLDKGVIGIAEWLFSNELQLLSQAVNDYDQNHGDHSRRMVQLHKIYLSLRFIQHLLENAPWSMVFVEQVVDIHRTLASCLLTLASGHFSSPSLRPICQSMFNNPSLDSTLQLAVFLTLLPIAHDTDILSILEMVKNLPDISDHAEYIQQNIGTFLAHFASFEPQSLSVETADAILYLLQWLSNKNLLKLGGMSAATFFRLCDMVRHSLAEDRVKVLEALQPTFSIIESEDHPMTEIVELPPKLELSLQEIDSLMRADEPVLPSTPNVGPTPDILDLVTRSPPTALLRSPVTATGLTRTYLNNDFRQQRQLPLSNTSRLPSLHVDVGLQL